MDSQACVKCNDACLTCDGSGQNACTSCPEGKYLKGDNTCVDANQCGADKYADKKTWTCKACDPDIAGCTACEYNDATGKPKCTNCNGKLIRTAADGTTTCVEANGCAQNNVAGTHFLITTVTSAYCVTTLATPANRPIRESRGAANVKKRILTQPQSAQNAWRDITVAVVALLHASPVLRTVAHALRKTWGRVQSASQGTSLRMVREQRSAFLVVIQPKVASMAAVSARMMAILSSAPIVSPTIASRAIAVLALSHVPRLVRILQLVVVPLVPVMP